MVEHKFAKRWSVPKPVLEGTIDLAAQVFSDRWTACDPCSDLIEKRDLERLITRVRRLDEQRLGKPQGPRSAYREHFAKFWSLVRDREPIDVRRS
ncbi:hypothetical protein [Amycolatopsis sp. NPDC004079]|uniref:hypothetical protein n=1 Tax=Amycolatopsis sp. NPDC004079 TaxID=3154549 RepID=UPI0033AEEFA5